MAPSDCDEFMKWHTAEGQRYAADSELKYDLRAEMLKYCEDDVKVLRLGFTAYREAYMADYHGIDPAGTCSKRDVCTIYGNLRVYLVSDFITLPSYINHCYRATAMPEKSMPITPPKGYKATQSREAICWLEWEAKVNDTPIKHARNSSEVKIGPYKVDGFARILKTEIDVIGYSKYKGHVWEFNGCFYHGCPTCIKDRGKPVGEYTSMDQRYKDTMNREKFLEERNYKLHVIWECQYKQRLRENKAMKAFVDPLSKRLTKYPNLRPRAALRWVTVTKCF
jgi:hypothetical protein